MGFGCSAAMRTADLMDLTGIDLSYTIGMQAFRETGDIRNLPGLSAVIKYVKGEFGRNTGKGWYDYS